MANWSSPSFTPVVSYGVSGCGVDIDIAMSRYVAPPASAARNSGMTNRGSVALSSASARCSASAAVTPASSLASSRTACRRGSPSRSTTARARSRS